MWFYLNVASAWGEYEHGLTALPTDADTVRALVQDPYSWIREYFDPHTEPAPETLPTNFDDGPNVNSNMDVDVALDFQLDVRFNM